MHIRHTLYPKAWPGLQSRPKSPLPLAGMLALAITLPAFADVSMEREVIKRDLSSNAASFDVVRLASGLEYPWGMAWLPDGRLLVTEKVGRLQLIDGDSITEVGNLPSIASGKQGRVPEDGQGGLLDVAVHPEYASNGWIYFTYSSPGDDDATLGDYEYGTATAVFRARLSEDGSELVDREHLYSQSPKVDPGRHYGSRIAFPGDGTMLVTIGDRGLRRPSQDLSDPAGSVIRLRENGGAHEANPFVRVAPGNLRPEIHAFGTRNMQGLTIAPDGTVWAVEHGPRGGDLLFTVEAGDNFGWPQVAFAGDYSTSEPIGIGREAPGVKTPAHVWEGRMAPSGLTYYDGDAFPGWQGSLFAGSLGFEQLHRIMLEGHEVVGEEVLLTEELGRIRDVAQGPDGYLYLLTDDEDGALYKLRPTS